MKIGFDVSQTGTQKAGCGYWAYELIKQLTAVDQQNQYILYSNFGPHVWDPDHARTTFRSNNENVSVQFADFTHEKARSFWQQSHADLDDELGSPDIIQANNFYCPPKLPRTRLVYTLYDLNFLIYPELTTEANRLVCFEGVFQASLTADRIIAISEFTRTHFLNIFPHYPAEHVKVLYPASRFAQTSNGRVPSQSVPHLPKDAFWLFVGTVEPRKNLGRLLTAYAQLHHAGETDFPLVIAGGDGWLEENLPNTIRKLGIEKNVCFLGYVSDKQLHWLYENCFAFVYPSLFEGFGLPVIEAMSVGTAVITSNISSLPEIAGEAAQLIDPNDAEALAQAMKQLLADETLHQTYRQKARKQAQIFSWRVTAVDLLNLYQDLIKP